jgi:GNAT superfamily N-acetyltransferase
MKACFRINMTRRIRYTREHWEQLCAANGHSWITTYKVWDWLWNPRKEEYSDRQACQQPVLLEDSLGRGFMLLDLWNPHPPYDIEIRFVLVDKSHRKEGIARKLLEQAEKRYPDKKLYLESIDETTHAIWTKCGFIDLVIQPKVCLLNGTVLMSKID